MMKRGGVNVKVSCAAAGAFVAGLSCADGGPRTFRRSVH